MWSPRSHQNSKKKAIWLLHEISNSVLGSSRELGELERPQERSRLGNEFRKDLLWVRGIGLGESELKRLT